MRNEELSNTVTAEQIFFNPVVAVPDVILFIREFLLLKDQRRFRNTNQAIRNIFENSDEPPENDVRDCILKQCEEVLLKYKTKGTVIELNFVIKNRPFTRIKFIVYDHQYTVLGTVQKEVPSEALHQTLNKELLQTVSCQINSLTSNPDRKIPLALMWLLAHKCKIIAIIIIIVGAGFATASPTLLKISYKNSISLGMVAISLLLFYLLILLRFGYGGTIQCRSCAIADDHKKNLPNALAVNVIKTGRIAVEQSNDDASVNLYIPKNALTFFQPKNDDALATTPDTRVVEIPETQAREPGANGCSKVGENETNSLLGYQQLQ